MQYPVSAKNIKIAEQTLNSQLIGDERLIWSGKPDRIAFAGANSFRSIFGRVVFIIGASMIYIALEAMAENPRSPGGILLIFGVIFIIFGGDLAAKTLINWWCAPDTYYGVTDKRAIILRIRPWFKIINFEGHEILFVLSEAHGDNGLGNIIFANEPFGRLRGLRAAVGFWGVEHPAKAVAALERLRPQL